MECELLTDAEPPGAASGSGPSFDDELSLPRAIQLDGKATLYRSETVVDLQ